MGNAIKYHVLDANQVQSRCQTGVQGVLESIETAHSLAFQAVHWPGPLPQGTRMFDMSRHREEFAGNALKSGPKISRSSLKCLPFGHGNA